MLAEFRIDPDVPFVLFVGRITRQKGIIHLVNAIEHVRPGTQVVLCAGAPDTPEIAREMAEAVERARAHSPNPIIWIPEMVTKEKVIALYTHAAIFVCPSVYEPFGIINLEAMACETPVVASAVGGIPEVVVPGETGLLVPIDAVGGGNVEPREPAVVLARAGGRRERAARGPGAPRLDGGEVADPRRGSLQLDGHREADPRVLRRAGGEAEGAVTWRAMFVRSTNYLVDLNPSARVLCDCLLTN